MKEDRSGASHFPEICSSMIVLASDFCGIFQMMPEIRDCLGIFHAKSKIQTAKTDFNREITKRGISRRKAGNHPFSRDFSGERFHRTICRVFFVGNAGSTPSLGSRMASARAGTSRPLMVTILATVVSIGAGCGITWSIWLIGWQPNKLYPLLPVAASVIVYAALVVTLLGRAQNSLWVLIAVELFGLAVTLLVGLACMEIVYCVYDRAGCINL